LGAHVLATLLVLGRASGVVTPAVQGQDVAERPPAEPVAVPTPAAGPKTSLTGEQPWVLDCPEPAVAASGRCQITQSLYGEDGDAPSVRLVVGYPANGTGPLMRLYVPTGVLIQPGLRLEIGTDTPTSIPLLVCTREHCVNETVMPTPLVQAMRRAEAGSLTMLVLPDAHEL
jgi:invasion protein IalB